MKAAAAAAAARRPPAVPLVAVAVPLLLVSCCWLPTGVGTSPLQLLLVAAQPASSSSSSSATEDGVSGEEDASTCIDGGSGGDTAPAADGTTDGSSGDGVDDGARDAADDDDNKENDHNGNNNNNNNNNNCRDLNERCPYWAAKGECDNNAIYMRSHCALSCDACDDGDNDDYGDDKDSGDDDYYYGSEYYEEDDEEYEEDGYYDEDDDDDDDYEEDDDGGCRDRNYKCKYWAQGGECRRNVPFMSRVCAASCGLCGGAGTGTGADAAVACEDVFKNCHDYVARGDCLVERGTMLAKCRRSCYFCAPSDDSGAEDEIRRSRIYQRLRLGPHQDIAGTPQEREGARDNLRQMDQYLRRVMLADDVTDDQRAGCANVSPNCAFWAGKGRCHDNKREFMLRNCPLSCMACIGPDDNGEREEILDK